MNYDADEILERMRGDQESDWAARLVTSIYGQKTQRRKDLTDHELAVLLCASHGLTVPMTAVLLGKSPETVNRQRDVARMKLGAKTTTHAVAIAIREGHLP